MSPIKYESPNTQSIALTERMGWVRGLVALQLIGLLVSSMYCDGEGRIDEEQHKLIFPHATAPAPAPILLPVKAPPPPAKTPPPPPFTLKAAVEGVVYCMSCKLPGYVPSLKASPLSGAPAILVCNNRRGVTINGNAKTNSRGYFLIDVLNKRPSAVSTCKVVLKLPAWCNRPVYPKLSPRAGFPIKFERIDRVGSSQLVLFTVGFLEFAPASTRLCPRQP